MEEAGEHLQREAGPWASLISHLRLFAFFCSFIPAAKEIKAVPEALSFAPHTSSCGLTK